MTSDVDPHAKPSEAMRMDAMYRAAAHGGRVERDPYEAPLWIAMAAGFIAVFVLGVLFGIVL